MMNDSEVARKRDGSGEGTEGAEGAEAAEASHLQPLLHGLESSVEVDVEAGARRREQGRETLRREEACATRGPGIAGKGAHRAAAAGGPVGRWQQAKRDGAAREERTAAHRGRG